MADRKSRSLDGLLAATAKEREAEMAQAREVLEHVYGELLKAPEFSLKDGTEAQITRFLNPEVTPDGDLQCGFDVILGDDDTHLEFTITNTGSGKSFVKEVIRERDEQRKTRNTP